MTEVEMKQAIEQLKAENHSDEEILGAFFKMFQDDKLTSDELDGITNLMGYHFSDEFAAMSDEDKKKNGYKTVENENVDKETIEDAKEVEPEDKEEDNGDAESEPNQSESDKSDEKEDKSDEEKKAMHLFGLKD